MAEKISDAISLPTLTRWELNTVKPSLKKIEYLVSFFLNQGVTVNSIWLLEGQGFPPLSMNLTKFDSTKFDELSYATLIGMRNKIKGFHFQQVNKNFFKPIISFGDYIGGIIEDNKKLLDGRLCFLCTDNLVTAGIYNYENNNISNCSGEIEEIRSESIKMGELQWIIRRP